MSSGLRVLVEVVLASEPELASELTCVSIRTVSPRFLPAAAGVLLSGGGKNNQKFICFLKMAS